jgi:undecaprenol kinase
MKVKDSINNWGLTFTHAFSGLSYIFKTEKSMRVHSLFGLAAIIFLILFKATILEWAIVILVIGLVISAEIMNTAIEVMVDLYCPFYHPLAKISKDVAAAGVLFTAIVSVIIGCLIFIPYIMRFVKSFF